MSGAWRGPRLGVQHAVRTDLRPTLEGPGRRTVGPSGPLNFSTTFVSERLTVSLHTVDEADASVRHTDTAAHERVRCGFSCARGMDRSGLRPEGTIR